MNISSTNLFHLMGHWLYVVCIHLVRVQVVPGPHVDPLAAGDAAASPGAPGASLTSGLPWARLRFWSNRIFSIFKGFYCVLRPVRLSDFIKVYGKYWTSQNWSGRNIHTENPANFTKEILVLYWVMIFRFKGSKRKRYFSIWGISWIGLLWNVLFTLLYKIDVKQTRIKVYCCDVVDGW